MADLLLSLHQRYPGAHVWAFGDSPTLADKLAALVLNGTKCATCSSVTAFQQNPSPVVPGSHAIILNGAGAPVCVIRTPALEDVRFCDVTPQQAALEGEGDLSLAWWRDVHQAFFAREGTFSPDMMLVMETFTLVETLA